MWGRFKKNGNFFIGDKRPFDVPNANGNRVEIAEKENHPIYGKRYKIVGRNEWFEENCFEYVIED